MNTTLFEGRVGAWIQKAILGALLFLGLFRATEAIGGLMGLKYVGAGVQAANTIVVTGHGETLAVPDIATFTFSVVSDKASVASAQSDATQKANAVTAYLKGQGIDEKDIKTTDYSVSPQYDYQNAVCPVAAPNSGVVAYCPPGRQVLKGYEVRQTTSIKVRDTGKAGDILAGVGGKGASEVSGLTFAFDDPTGAQATARAAAIADAKQKARVLAGQLGVSLARIVSFSENSGGSNPSPMVYGMAAAPMDKAAAPVISVGQNKIQSDVSVTYEIQ